MNHLLMNTSSLIQTISGQAWHLVFVHAPHGRTTISTTTNLFQHLPIEQGFSCCMHYLAVPTAHLPLLPCIHSSCPASLSGSLLHHPGPILASTILAPYWPPPSWPVPYVCAYPCACVCAYGCLWVPVGSLTGTTLPSW